MSTLIMNNNDIIKIRPIEDVFSISWITHLRCNYDCMYCPTTRHNTTDKLLSLEELKSYWHQIFKKTSHLNKKYKISFSGGEPTINKNLLPFVEYLKSNFNDYIHHINVISNGSANTQHYLKFLRHVNSISFSTHTEFMDKEKFLNTVKICSAYAKAHKKVCHVNIMEEYWADSTINELIDFFKIHNIDYSMSPVDYSVRIRDFPIFQIKNEVIN